MNTKNTLEHNHALKLIPANNCSLCSWIKAEAEGR
jgi:hypothetical protein